MRKTVFTLALLAITAITQNTRADDFSALLSDLSFGDLPSLNQPLSVAKVKPEAQLKPAPKAEKVAATLKTAPSKVALQTPVAVKPLADPSIDADINFDAAFAAQEVPSKTVGHLFHHNRGCDSGCAEETVINCSPHVKPNLPSSTLYQYFRTNKCNTHVWDGYQQKCRSANKHINGTCDCFDGKHGKRGCGLCGDHGCSSCQSGSCDSTGCTSCDGR
jgi:hypothetical protein